MGAVRAAACARGHSAVGEPRGVAHRRRHASGCSPCGRDRRTGRLLLAAAVPFGVYALVKSRLQRRRARFAEQLPDNLQVIASALRAGHSLVGALAVLTEDVAEPSQTEFRRVLADEQVGVPLEDALADVGERMGSRDLAQISVVAALQRETGGNSAEVIDRVTETIRQRFELRRLVKTLTTQGRMSRWVVSLLPVVLFFVINLINPDYMKPLYEHSAGRVLIVVAAAMVFSGSLRHQAHRDHQGLGGVVTLFLLLGLGLVVTSVALLARALAPAAAAARSRRSGTSADMDSGGRTPIPRRRSRSIVDAVADSLGSFVASRVGSAREERASKRAAVGRLLPHDAARVPRVPGDPDVLLALGWAWVASTSAMSGGAVVVGIAIATLAGWFGPLQFVKSRSMRRLERIDYELPELIDLLIVTVEAGLGFASSLQVASTRVEGPLGDELKLVLQEQAMGLSTEETLRNMLARADTPSVRSFVRAIIQGETLGVSIGQILRNISVEMRSAARRRRRSGRRRLRSRSSSR